MLIRALGSPPGLVQLGLDGPQVLPRAPVARPDGAAARVGLQHPRQRRLGDRGAAHRTRCTPRVRTAGRAGGVDSDHRATIGRRPRWPPRTGRTGPSPQNPNRPRAPTSGVQGLLSWCCRRTAAAREVPPRWVSDRWWTASWPTVGRRAPSAPAGHVHRRAASRAFGHEPDLRSSNSFHASKEWSREFPVEKGCQYCVVATVVARQRVCRRRAAGRVADRRCGPTWPAAPCIALFVSCCSPSSLRAVRSCPLPLLSMSLVTLSGSP